MASGPQLADHGAASTPSAGRIGRGLIDEGHHNYHTSTGGYAAYTRLLGRYDLSMRRFGTGDAGGVVAGRWRARATQTTLPRADG